MTSRFHIAVCAVVAAMLLAIALPNAGPVLRAALAEGTWGTFTASRLACVQHPGHEACTWYGTFASPKGTREVALYGSDRATLTQGRQVPAVDVGRPAQVYTEGGSNEWILTLTLLLAGVALLLPLLIAVRRSRTR
jgi:hypothetical protein